MRVALHPVCCLCSFQVRARPSRVRGWSVFALNRSQRVYVPRISQMPIISRVNIFWHFCIVVLRVYDMSCV